MNGVTTRPPDRAETERYHKVEKMLWRIAHRFHQRHGGDLTEYRSAADLGYAQAVATWDPSRSQFQTHVWNCATWAILDHVRTYTMQHRLPVTDGELPDMPARVDRLPALMGEASEDAKTVMRLALTAPGDPSPRGKLGWVTDLLWDLGWAAKRILESFAEVKELLRP